LTNVSLIGFPSHREKRFRSLGVTTYVLLTGFSPFGGETDQETFQNISLGEVDFPEELFEDVSAQAKDFVAKLLVLNPR
jgi:serine/threonine protein kinase